MFYWIQKSSDIINAILYTRTLDKMPVFVKKCRNIELAISKIYAIYKTILGL